MKARGILFAGIALVSSITAVSAPGLNPAAGVSDSSSSQILIAFKFDPSFAIANRIDVSTGLHPVSSDVPSVAALLTKYSASYSRQLFVNTRLKNVYELAIKGDSSLAISELMNDPNVIYARLSDPGLEAQVLETIKRINSQTGGVWVAGYTIPGIMTPADRRKLLSSSSLPARPAAGSSSQQAADARFSAIHKSLASGQVSGLPSSFDWRTYNNTNYITPVKDQGSCGDCWAFSATGSIQDEANAYYNNYLGLNLSEQQLLSCSGAGSCEGGGSGAALAYAQSSGQVTEACFAYAAADGVPCSNMCANPVYWKIASSTFLPTGSSGEVSDSDIQIGLLVYGPSADYVALYSDFYYYVSGVYYPTAGATFIGDHAFVVVGFGFAPPPPSFDSSSDTVLYMSGKNSWGPSWGQNGFFQIFSGVAEDNQSIVAINAPAPPTAQNAICQDLDGAGHCYWGLGPRPANGCPSSCTSAMEYCAYSGSNQAPAACLTSASFPQTTPTVAVTPASTSITTAQSLQVTVTVSGGPGNPTPTGNVSVSGGRIANMATLSGGSATMAIAAGALPVGVDVLIASYTPDAASSSIYNSASGASPAVIVSNSAAPSFIINGTEVSVPAGAATENTSTITVTPASGFTGIVTLTAAITASPAGAQYPPTLNFGTNTVTISGTSAGVATLTIYTTAPSKPAPIPLARKGFPFVASGSATAVCIVLLWIPALRRRGWRSTLGCVVLFFAISAGLLACGGGSGGTGDSSGTTTGGYTITVTGTSGTLVESSTVGLEVR